jgi:hypothetical protein
MIPENIAMLYGIPDLTDDQKAVVERIISGDLNDTTEILLALGRHWKLKIWFKVPVKVNTTRHWIPGENPGTRFYKTANVGSIHVFSGLFSASTYPICYTVREGGRNGYIFPDKSKDLNLITKYEVMLKTEPQEFESYEKFKAKFDPQFITDTALKDLWNTNSAQHGGQYAPSDFKALSRDAKIALTNFLRNFKGVTNTDTTAYTKSGCDEKEYYSLTSREYNSKRDITISHGIIKSGDVITPRDTVSYSSEFKGTGNGRYGLIVNKNTYLHLEDD